MARRMILRMGLGGPRTTSPAEHGTRAEDMPHGPRNAGRELSLTLATRDSLCGRRGGLADRCFSLSPPARTVVDALPVRTVLHAPLDATHGTSRRSFNNFGTTLSQNQKAKHRTLCRRLLLLVDRSDAHCIDMTDADDGPAGCTNALYVLTINDVVTRQYPCTDCF